MKKLHLVGAPNNEEIAFGAVMMDGMTYLNSDFEPPVEYIEIEKKRQIQEIKRRMQLYLAKDSANHLDVCKIDKNTIVILVDDGVASGATFIIAARWLRKFHNPKKIIASAIVAPKETIRNLKDEEIDEVEVITKPHS